MRQKYNLEIISKNGVDMKLLKIFFDKATANFLKAEKINIIELKQTKQKMIKDAETRLNKARKDFIDSKNSSFAGFIHGGEIIDIENEIEELKRL